MLWMRNKENCFPIHILIWRPGILSISFLCLNPNYTEDFANSEELDEMMQHFIRVCTVCLNKNNLLTETEIEIYLNLSILSVTP